MGPRAGGLGCRLLEDVNFRQGRHIGKSSQKIVTMIVNPGNRDEHRWKQTLKGSGVGQRITATKSEVRSRGGETS